MFQSVPFEDVLNAFHLGKETIEVMMGEYPTFGKEQLEEMNGRSSENSTEWTIIT